MKVSKLAARLKEELEDYERMPTLYANAVAQFVFENKDQIINILANYGEVTNL